MPTEQGIIHNLAAAVDTVKVVLAATVRDWSFYCSISIDSFCIACFNTNFKL